MNFRLKWGSRDSWFPLSYQLQTCHTMSDHQTSIHKTSKQPTPGPAIFTSWKDFINLWPESFNPTTQPTTLHGSHHWRVTQDHHKSHQATQCHQLIYQSILYFIFQRTVSKGKQSNLQRATCPGLGPGWRSPSRRHILCPGVCLLPRLGLDCGPQCWATGTCKQVQVLSVFPQFVLFCVSASGSGRSRVLQQWKHVADHLSQKETFQNCKIPL